MLLHDVRNEAGIEAFLAEVHDLYVRALLNPFYAPGTRVTSPGFRARVKTSAKRHL